jgi:hypothetical protein
MTSNGNELESVSAVFASICFPNISSAQQSKGRNFGEGGHGGYFGEIG